MSGAAAATAPSAFIAPPTRIPLVLRFGLWVVRRRTGRDLLPPRLLAWYPKAAISSGVVEALVAHADGAVTERVLKLVRMTVSFTASCPFCVGFNSDGWEQLISPDEFAATQGRVRVDDVPTLAPHERLAIEYARLASQTPIAIPRDFGQRLAAAYTPRELVVLASTIAQVNYWARLIQGLGCPPEG